MKRFRRVILKIAIVLAVLLAAAGVSLALWKRSLDAQLDRELAALRRDGAPVDVSALARGEVPPGDDALPWLRKGVELAAQHEDVMLLLGLDYDYFYEEAWSEVEAWVKRQAPARDAFARAAEKPACSWIYDESVPPAAWEMETIPAVQEATRLLEADARVRLHRGAPTAEVLAVAGRLTALARHVDDRFVIGWLVRRTVENIARDLVRDAALAPDSDLDAVRAWLAAHAGERGVRPLADVLAYERVYALALLGPRHGGLAGQLDRLREQAEELERTLGPAAGNGDAFDAVIGMLRVPVSPGVSLLLHSPAGPALDRRVALAWLASDARAIAASQTVKAGTPTALREVLETSERLWFDPFGPPAAGLAPRLAEQLLARRAHFSVTAAGIAVLAWRRAHGGWPPSLEAAGAQGVDPFTDGPLRYEHMENGGATISVSAPARFDDLAWSLSG